jgi:DNA-binding FadR family transcriptional regulator
MRHADAMREAASSQRRGAAADEARIGAEAAFHDRLVAAAGNRPMRRMLEPVHLALATARQVLTADDPGATLRGHERIARAVQRQDPVAARRAITADVNALTRALEKAQIAIGQSASK